MNSKEYGNHSYIETSDLESTVKVCVVQLEGHASIAIEDRDYFSEPFRDPSDLPILTQVEREYELKEIRSLRKEFFNEYLSWARSRLLSVFRFLDGLSNADKPDLIVFPEFAIPFELLWIPALFTRGGNNSESCNDWVVVAGNHAYKTSKKSYLRCFNQPNEPSTSPNDGFLLDTSPLSGSAANSLLVTIASPNCITKTEKNTGYGERCQTENTKRAVFARFKEKLSPYEFTSTHKEAVNNSIALNDTRRWIYELRTRENDTYRINVFVCAEALQGINTHSEAHIGVVVAYHDRPSDYQRFVEQSIKTRHIAIVASDGRFGESCIAMNADRRIPDWTREAPENGILPKGDLIQISELPIVPTSGNPGSTNPFKLDRLVLLASIIGNGDTENYETTKEIVKILRSEEITKLTKLISDSSEDERINSTEVKAALEELEQIIEDLRAESLDLASSLNALLVKYSCAPLLKTKIHALARHAASGQLSANLITCLALDCLIAPAGSPNLIQREDFEDGSQSTSEKPSPKHSRKNHASLHGLEVSFAIRTHSWLRHRTEAGNLSPKAVEVAITAQRRCAKVYGATSETGPMHALRRIKRSLREQVKRRTYSNANQILGTIIERFEASSGWVFHYSKTGNELWPPLTLRFNKNGVIETSEAKVIGVLQEIVSHNVPLSTEQFLLPVYDLGPLIEKYGEESVLQNPCLDDIGICSYAVSIRNAILVSDLKRSKYERIYYRNLASTVSLVSIPIFEADGTSIRGMLVLESDERHSFMHNQVGELVAIASTLLSEILIAQAIDRKNLSGCWHPELSGWDLSNILREFADQIATSLNEVETVQSLSCTIWNADWDKNVLFVLAAARFNFEYITERLLALTKKPSTPEASWQSDQKSFTGDVACLPPAKVERTLISEIHGYYRQAKARRMGVAYLVSCPIYPRHARKKHLNSDAPATETEEKDKALGVLNLYFFRRQHPRFEFSIDGVFPDHDVATLAAFFGDMITSTNQLRQKVGIAHLLGEIRERGVAETNLNDLFRDILMKLFESDTVTIFLGEVLESSREKIDTSLRVLSTTGIAKPTNENEELGVLLESVFILTEGDHRIVEGLTPFLVARPESSLRKIDIPDQMEPSSWKRHSQEANNPELDLELGEDSLFFRQNELNRDSAEPTPIEHRRFLGASISLDDRHVYVVRMNRDSTSKPFLREDQDRLYNTLDGFRHQLTSNLPQARSSAWKSRLFAPDRGLVAWNRRYIESLLQDSILSLNDDLKELNLPFEIDLAYVRIRNADSFESEQLKYCYGHSIHTMQTRPIGRLEHLGEKAFGSEWATLRANHPFTVLIPSGGTPESKPFVELGGEQFFLSPLVTRLDQNRVYFMAPFSIGSFGWAPDAMIFIEGSVGESTLEHISHQMKDCTRLFLRYSHQLARRLSCLSRDNIKPVTLLSEAELSHRVLTDHFEQIKSDRKQLPHNSEEKVYEKGWYGIRQFSHDNDLGTGCGIPPHLLDKWRELVLQNKGFDFFEDDKTGQEINREEENKFFECKTASFS